MPWEHVAAVPGSEAGTVVAVDGALPRIVTDSYRLADALDAFEPLIGRPVFLRVGAHVDLGDERYVRLFEFDAASTGLAWAPLDPGLAPPEVRDAFERWSAEQQGAPIPELRPPWSRPGWLARAEAWVGRTLAPQRLWPLSAVLESDGDYLKAVFRLFHHEPAVTQALAREHPGDVPDVLRIDEREGWLLMRELRGTPAYELDANEAALATLERIQHAWRGRGSELRALGAPDRSLSVLERTIPTIAPPAHVDALQRACRELASRGEPETIVHGDFHSGNVVVDGAGRAVIFDWSDACVAHPACDRFVLAGNDDWDPVEAIVASLHQAVSYRAISANLEPADRWWFADAEHDWLGSALKRLD